MNKLLKNKKILFAILGVFLLALIIISIMIINGKKLTELEKMKIYETSEKIENYIDEVLLHEDDEGRYISFAIEYLYNETNKNEYSVDDIIEVINTTFDIDYTAEEILQIGISLEMLNKGIIFDSSSYVFKYDTEKTLVDIADTSLVKYSIKEIKKKNKEEFKVVYEKYIVENPYEVLNYYNDKNINKKEDEEEYDTRKIIGYLSGTEKVGVIKKIINSENIKEVGKIEEGPTLIYIVKDGNLVIKENIKR